MMDVGAIVLVQLESAIAFGDECWCDRTCSIGECDRVWGWMWVRSYLWDWRVRSSLVMWVRSYLWNSRVRSLLLMDVGAIVLVGFESAIASFFYGILKSDRLFPKSTTHSTFYTTTNLNTISPFLFNYFIVISLQKLI